MKEYIQQLSPDKLIPFQKHPYQVREDAALSELVESIHIHGVLSPLLARPKDEGYELVSGHRRRLAAQKLDFPTVPVLVREMTDDEAVILMVDSNLQRENLLPSEKAFAYKMKLEAIKHQGRATSGQLVQKLSVEKVADEANENYKTVQRYIRLTNLVQTPVFRFCQPNVDLLVSDLILFHNHSVLSCHIQFLNQSVLFSLSY